MEVPQNPPGVLPDGRVVLNVASEEELRRLPGVGPARARAIVELRKRRGKFRSFSELLRVKGIGRKSLARMTPKMTLDPG
jgi:competence protein ComEA